jgi:hypothetical protein
MRLLSRLEADRKSGAICYVLFRQSPEHRKPVHHSSRVAAVVFARLPEGETDGRRVGLGWLAGRKCSLNAELLKMVQPYAVRRMAG